MMARRLCLFLSLLLLLLKISSSSSFAYAGPVNPHPHELRSFKIGEEKVQDNNQQQLGRGCSYTVKIKTSCSSPRYTRDAVSLAFGDAYRNEVYVPRLDDPSSRTFERCSSDTFNIQGPCGYGICYLYLYRNGWDGWIPDSVKVYEVNYRRAVTFYYGSPLPNAVWFGFNQCSRISFPSTNATELASVNGVYYVRDYITSSIWNIFEASSIYGDIGSLDVDVFAPWNLARGVNPTCLLSQVLMIEEQISLSKP